MTLLTQILFGLTAWTTVSIVVGLGLGAFLRECGAADAAAPTVVTGRTPALKRTA